MEGDTGYIKTSQGIRAVVVGKTSRQKTKLHIVGTENYLSLNPTELQTHLKDNKDEVK
ncbi:hypothetical protein P4U03_28230 [Bacillus mycoides]|uniref:hypothetical protein n=1 Tax=Bacillus mycoides TaxID=1405 RepID=UPI0015947A79|nr:hypothetical protein [Bacillus mycoides]MED1270371.1 hypothetical protein [Bacillus mycoides]